MKRYEFDENTRGTLEGLSVPFCIYQSISGKTVTILASDGFCKFIGMSRKDAIYLMDHDMFKGTHPEDRERVADLANRFAAEGGDYDVAFSELLKQFFGNEGAIVRSDGCGSCQVGDPVWKNGRQGPEIVVEF